MELTHRADADADVEVADGDVRGWLDVEGWFVPAPGTLVELEGTGGTFDGRLRVASTTCELTAASVVSRLPIGG